MIVFLSHRHHDSPGLFGWTLVQLHFLVKWIGKLWKPVWFMMERRERMGLKRKIGSVCVCVCAWGSLVGLLVEVAGNVCSEVYRWIQGVACSPRMLFGVGVIQGHTDVNIFIKKSDSGLQQTDLGWDFN